MTTGYYRKTMGQLPLYLPPVTMDGLIYSRIQEENAIPPGHCLNPFEPLLGADQPVNELARSLYDLAFEIDDYGFKGDYMDSLDDLTLEIKSKIVSWYEIGLKAWKIKLYKAYNRKFKSFSQFCERAIGKTASSVNNWIRAARVMSHLIAAGCERLPLNASIALELSKFSDRDLIDAWRSIYQTFPDHEITLDRVKSHLANPRELEPSLKRVNIPIDLWEKLREKAAEGGISPSKLLEQLLKDSLPDDEDEDDDDDDSEDDDTIDPELEQELPNFAKRYRSNFAPEIDGYYVTEDPRRAYTFINGILEDVSHLVPF